MDQIDRARFEVIYRENVRPLLRYVLAKTNRENAHDVISSTFLVAWRRFYDVPEDPLPWLIGVARRILADKWRSEARQAALVQRLSDQASTLPTSMVDVAESTFMPGYIRDALQQLRPKDREVLTLVAWQDFNTEQLAVALDCSKSVASLRLHRARGRFAKLLDGPQSNPVRPRQQMLRTAKEVQ